MNESLSKSEFDKLRILILQSIDGMIDKQGALQLENILQDSASAREYYTEYVSIYCNVAEITESAKPEPYYYSKPDSKMSELLEALSRDEENAPTENLYIEPQTAEDDSLWKQSRQPVSRKKSMWVLAVSVAAVLVIAVFFKIADLASANHIGQLTNVVNADWSDIRGNIYVGSRFYAGPMKLNKGLAEITFNSGAVVVAEAPCEFVLEDDGQMVLHNGSIVVDVGNSAKKRFVVRTGNSLIIDCGTEFGVNVDETGITRAYVFEGKVKMLQNHKQSQKALLLDAGSGGISDSQGRLNRETVNTNIFVRKKQFDTQMLASKGSSYHRWEAYNYKLHRDKSLIAHYTFEQADRTENKLLNTSGYTDVPDGVLGSEGFDKPEWIQGRWPQKAALRFDDKKNNAVVIPAADRLGIAGEISLAAWFKGDIKSGKINGHIISSRIGSAVNYSLYLRTPEESGNTKITKIQPLFTRRKSGNLHIESYAGDKGMEIDAGSWHLVCVTHDNKVVRFYLDGKLLTTLDYVYEPKMITADTVIGNSSSDYNLRKYNGIIDEIAVFGRVLKGKEIKEMYEAGKN